MFHTQHYYHMDGYVEMKMRLSKEVKNNPELPENQQKIKLSDDEAIFLTIHCESCNKTILSKEQVTRQL